MNDVDGIQIDNRFGCFRCSVGIGGEWSVRQSPQNGTVAAVDGDNELCGEKSDDVKYYIFVYDIFI